jgi:hypothetical protein
MRPALPTPFHQSTPQPPSALEPQQVAVFAFPDGHRFHFQDLDGYELAVWSDK